MPCRAETLQNVKSLEGLTSDKTRAAECNLEGSQDSGDLGQIEEPFRTQMYKAYKVNGATTASWTKQRLLGYDRVQL